MVKGNKKHRRLRRRSQRIQAEMLRRGGPMQRHGWAARQAAKRANTHKRKGSVAGSIYWR
jgi:hypothetical protein